MTLSVAKAIARSRRHSLLTADEELRLAQRSAQGDRAARNRLIEANLRLVHYLARGFNRSGAGLEDLVQEGNLGLLEAAERFDAERGVRFSSYAAWWIRARMLRYLLGSARLVKLGTTQAQRKVFFNLRKIQARRAAAGEAIDDAALAASMGVDERQLSETALRLRATDMSLDEPVHADGTENRVDTLPTPHDAPDTRLAQAEVEAVVRTTAESFTHELDARDGALFRARWLTDSPVTLAGFAADAGISRERARQLEQRLLGRLRARLVDRFGSAQAAL